MSGVDAARWGVLAGGAVVVAVAIAVAWRMWADSLLPWRELPGYYPGASYRASRDVDPRFITAALQEAESCLILRTEWGAANLALVGCHVVVLVGDDSTLSRLLGRRTRGLRVDRSLSELCHELAHLCELVLDGSANEGHVDWDVKGVARAVADYEGWLKRRVAA